MPHDSAVRDKLCSRLAALGKMNERLLHARGPILFSALLRSELEHFETSRVTMSGPDFACGENAVVCPSLIFHELATNAAKYGALAAPNGRIAMAWSIANGQLCVEWREEGVLDVRAPDRKGFGSKLLQSATAQFRGRVQQLFESNGLRC
jgi:two-component sensor histidine kinase